MPKITLLQYFILSTLIKKEQGGEEIRKKIKFEKSRPAFYMLMKKMEKEKLIKGKYVVTISKNYKVRIRSYSITENGIKTYNQFRNFVMDN